MIEIVKVCKKHGQLSPDNAFPKGKNKQGEPYYACLICKHEIAKRYYKNNFNAIAIKKKEYDKEKKLNPDWKNKKSKWMQGYNQRIRNDITRVMKLRERENKEKKKYYRKHQDKILEKNNETIKNLSDSYIKSYLKSWYKIDNPSNDLIETKRTLMKMRRFILAINANNGKNKYVQKNRYSKKRIQGKEVFKVRAEGSEESS